MCLKMYINISYKFHRIPDTQSRFITKVHDLLGQPSYLTYDLDIRVKAIRNVTQYPLLYVTLLGTKFEVAMSNGLGRDAFTKKYII